ncbi:unnamed protein product [Didymodactylos carnosus]|uniref:Uncharacterized protein n=1 Tax=Didymodactylos carnosus TaxID=1234261 RepID=A0A813T650_9BILA|nr:unnamed protein product [Didymodactylos carnosus]CAF0806862.1 unnamed protein product [Didymodactylos carnosus]CAF3504162.1 unnamed protein product [Didymodactylos carnosus]CAF3592327.1 unnamed protein product [Didymodactylos carnosus]
MTVSIAKPNPSSCRAFQVTSNGYIRNLFFEIIMEENLVNISSSNTENEEVNEEEFNTHLRNLIEQSQRLKVFQDQQEFKHQQEIIILKQLHDQELKKQKNDYEKLLEKCHLIEEENHHSSNLIEQLKANIEEERVQLNTIIGQLKEEHIALEIKNQQLVKKIELNKINSSPTISIANQIPSIVSPSNHTQQNNQLLTLTNTSMDLMVNNEAIGDFILEKITDALQKSIDDVKNLEQVRDNLNTTLVERANKILDLEQQLATVIENLEEEKQKTILNKEIDQTLFKQYFDKEIEQIEMKFQKQLTKMKEDYRIMYNKQFLFMKKKLERIKDEQTQNFDELIGNILQQQPQPMTSDNETRKKRKSRFD